MLKFFHRESFSQNLEYVLEVIQTLPEVIILMLLFQVHVSKYIGKSKLEYRGTKVVTVEKHVKCNCECKVKPTVSISPTFHFLYSHFLASS